MSHRAPDLMEWFRANGFDQYGAVITKEQLLDFLKIDVPLVGTWHDFRKVELALLDPVRYLRDTLLHEGKYLKKDRDVFRILLPSENAAQIRSFEDSAGKKLKRAATLSATTPAEHKDVRDNTEIRLLMKLDSIKNSRPYGNPKPPSNQPQPPVH